MQALRMLDDLQLDQIADPQLRESIRRLMNLVEQLSAENQQLREKVLLHHSGIQISEGQISNLLIKQQEPLHTEKQAIAEAALAASPWQ